VPRIFSGIIPTQYARRGTRHARTRTEAVCLLSGDARHRDADQAIRRGRLGAAHANSICAFSGLEDGDGAGFPGPGGAPPQNWGHSKEFFGATPAERKASGFQPGDSCNGHSGRHSRCPASS